MYDHVKTIQLIEDRFPELSEELHDEICDNLLHPQIAVFSRFAQSVIDDANSELWNSVSQTFWEVWKDCTPEVTNALNVSFLEHLNFSDAKKKRSWAYVAMHPAMRKAWDEMEAYNRKLHGR